MSGPEDEQYGTYRVLRAGVDEAEIDAERDYTPDPRYVRKSASSGKC